MTDQMRLSADEAVQRAREVASRVLAPLADQLDADARWPREGLRALLDADLGGLVVPTDSGGHGHGLLELAQVCEALAETCASTAICFGMHCVAAAVIAAKATEDQKQRYLVPIAQGKHFTTLALSEPGTGSQFYIPQMQMVRTSADTFRCTGQKTFVTNGGHADSYVMSAAPADEMAVPGEFSCFVVPANAPGLSWSEPWAGWGMRGNSAMTVSVDGVEVPRSDLLGSEGDEIWYVFSVVAPYFIVAMAGTYLGIVTAALEDGRAHVTQRTHAHTGLSLAHNPIVQHRFGELWAEVERTRALIYRAAAKGDAGAADSLLALCSAKAEVAESSERVISGVMSLMGGLAYRKESRIQQRYRDARAAHIMSPTTDMLRSWTGRAFLDVPLLTD